MPKITKRTVDAAAADPNGGTVFIWDETLKGFGLRVTQAGAKSYVLQYRTAGGRTRRATIGRHGSPWSPEEARAQAEGMLRGLAAGRDPLDEKAGAREALTIVQLVDLYLEEGPAEKPNKKTSSWKADASNLRRHVVPLLGKKLARDLTQAEIVKFQRDVAAGKTAMVEKTKARGKAVVEGGKGTAARTLAVLGAMLEFAAKPDRAIITSNPAKGVKPFKGGTKERFLTLRSSPSWATR